MSSKLISNDKRSNLFFGAEYVTFIKYYVIFAVVYKIFVVVNNTIKVVSVISLYVKSCSVSTTESKRSTGNWDFYLWGILKIWLMIHCFAHGIMDIKLYKTCTKPNPSYLRLYVMAQSLALTAFFAYWILITVYIENELLRTKLHEMLGFALTIIIFSVLYYYVLGYARESEYDVLMQSNYRPLSEEEINWFEKGEEFQVAQNHPHPFVQLVQSEAYNREEFEIPRNEFDLRDAAFLGRGEYGLVFKVDWNGSEVALKTVDPEMSDVNQFKSLLSEAKVMMRIGHHENVIRLLGLCTDRLAYRDLYIICELCEFGNMNAFLRSERHTFVDSLICDSNYDDRLTTRDLLRWCIEIAAGMEFLSSKKQIVHGDLATRNVLLTNTKTAKVTDFGLSRRLYNYSVYQRRKNVPLPWRWLALESLVDLSFSSKSDVWAYGITCWEIFELGAIPWPEYHSFDGEFVDGLKDGKIPPKGALCSDETYAVVMSCWNLNRKERPNFTFLKNYFLGVWNTITTRPTSMSYELTSFNQ